MSTSSESTDLTGWRARATPLDNFADAFVPAEEALVVAVCISTMARSGFITALFEPDIAVDTRGTVLRLQTADFAGLVALARATLKIPHPSQWRIQSYITCQPIYDVVIDGNIAYGIYNWSASKRTLEEPFEGRTELPDEVQAFFTLAHEDVDVSPHPNADIAERVDDLIARVRSKRYRQKISERKLQAM